MLLDGDFEDKNQDYIKVYGDLISYANYLLHIHTLDMYDFKFKIHTFVYFTTMGPFICSDKIFIAMINYFCIAETHFVTRGAHTFRMS